MQRFEPGDDVLVRRFMGASCEPPRCGVIRQVYGTQQSLLYDYLVIVGGREYSVRDEWLVPVSITISEDVDLSDLAFEAHR